MKFKLLISILLLLISSLHSITNASAFSRIEVKKMDFPDSIQVGTGTRAFTAEGPGSELEKVLKPEKGFTFLRLEVYLEAPSPGSGLTINDFNLRHPSNNTLIPIDFFFMRGDFYKGNKHSLIFSTVSPFEKGSFGVVFSVPQQNVNEYELYVANTKSGTISDFRKGLPHVSTQTFDTKMINPVPSFATPKRVPPKNTKSTGDFRALHILVKTKKEAEQILAELSNGKDFSTIAKEKSIAPTAVIGGDLGFFNKGDFNPLFEKAITNIDINDISEIIEFNGKFNIFKRLK